MIVQGDGFYLRQSTIDDVAFVRDALRDWPLGDWGYESCWRMVIDSDQYFDVSASEIPSAAAIYCSNDDTRIGVVHFSKLAGDSIDIHVIAIHRDHRGTGLFDGFASLVATMARDALAAESVQFNVIDSAPQVSQWAKQRGATSEKISDGREAIAVDKSSYDTAIEARRR